MSALNHLNVPGMTVPADGEGNKLSLSFAAELGLVEGILSLVEEWAARLGTYKDDRTSLRLVLEELLLNLCLHATKWDKDLRADLVIEPIFAPNGYCSENNTAPTAPTSQIPGQMTGRASDKMQGQMQGQTQGQLPGQSPGQAQGRAQGRAPNQTPGQVQRFIVSLQDTGAAFNPLEYEGAESRSAGSLKEAAPGGHGLTLVRMLTAEREYTRRHGNNILKLSMVCTGPGASPTTAQEPHGSSTSGVAASGESFFTALPRIWHSNLTIRQVTLFFCISFAMLWGGLLFYYLAAEDSREENTRKLCAQALHTQNLSSSTFLERLSKSFTEFTQGLAALPDYAEIVDDGDAFFASLRDGVLIRTVTADPAVLGVVRGELGNPEAMLLYRTGDSVSRLQLPLDLDAFVEQSVSGGLSASGGQSVWVGPIRHLPGDVGKGHAGMLLAMRANAEKDNDVWIGLVITMPWIAATLDALSGFEDVASVFITEKGEYVVYPPGRNVHSGPQSLTEEAGTDAVAMQKLLEAIKNRETGITSLAKIFPGDVSPWAKPWAEPWAGDTTLAYAPMTIPGWSFLLLVPSIEVGNTPPDLPLPMLFLALFGPFLVAVAAWKACTGVIQPLGRLSDALRKIADGDLETPLPAPAARDEIGGMLHAFEHVRVTLKHSFANLMEATASEQRVRNELTLARAIQESMLPASPPDIPGIRVATSIDMAGEVCGDLFDCFTLPDEPDAAYCLIGDVCGKGIPASVVMSRAMVLARSFLLSGETLPGTLARLNEALLRSSDSLMFVTLLVGRLERKTGRFAWASAGHPPPMLGVVSTAGKTSISGSLPWSGELVLGVKPGCVYTEHSIQLERGQSVLLYTDGADEAMALDNSDTPTSSGRSDSSETLTRSGESDSSDTHGTTAAVGASKISSASDITGTPDILGTSDTPGTPDILGTPDTSDTPNHADMQPGQTEGMHIFGADRLQAVFASACKDGTKGPQTVLDEVRSALVSYTGTSPFDDISLIVIRWDGA